MSLIDYPYPSRRSSVLAANAMVATSQPLAAQSGLAALARGGNAVDAAIATAAALTVLEPTSNGLGSDAFAIVWDGASMHALNGSGRWPATENAQRYRDAGAAEMPERGWPSVTVPGAVDSWLALHERFGRLEFGSLLESAAIYAETGFPVSPVISRLWANAAENFLAMSDPAISAWAQVFAPGGAPPAAGQMWHSPGHAACLRSLQRNGARDFYEGYVAERIAHWARETGGHLTVEDLAAHRSEWVEPIHVAYRDHEVWELPPNGQGIAALEALGILARTGFADTAPDSADEWHLQIEAMKLAFADAYRYVADPAHVEVPTAGLLDSAYLDARAALVGEEAADPGPGAPPTGGTVYLCTADRDGMMVSFIQSNYMGFGSGVVVPDVGVSMQNRGAGFVLDADHPNVAAPGKRPRHTIIPAFLTRGGEAVGPFGVMGGEMQPQGHMQVVCSMVDRGRNAQSALDAPRWKVLGGRAVEVEPQTDPRIIAGLEHRGHEVVVSPSRLSFGRGQIIRRLPGGVLEGASEPRADGAATGF